ncbi:MAG: ankyrin repeat domain-containing protein [Rickettsiaceae bacterium]|nr:ankyrin repeat domain-containing protein [Rickettsiaceae bacterium]
MSKKSGGPNAERIVGSLWQKAEKAVNVFVENFSNIDTDKIAKNASEKATEFAEQTVKVVKETTTKVMDTLDGENVELLHMIERGIKNNTAVLEYIESANLSTLNYAPHAGITLLHLAAEAGNLDVCKALIEKGVGIDTKTEKGNSALDVAAMYGHEDLCINLIEKGAYVTENSCIQAHEKSHETLAKRIASIGLLHSINEQNVNLCEKFINLGADVNYVTTTKGRSLLEIAVTQKNPNIDICERLVKEGAKVNKDIYSQITNEDITKLIDEFLIGNITQAAKGSNSENIEKEIGKMYNLYGNIDPLLKKLMPENPIDFSAESSISEYKQQILNAALKVSAKVGDDMLYHGEDITKLIDEFLIGNITQEAKGNNSENIEKEIGKMYNLYGNIDPLLEKLMPENPIGSSAESSISEYKQQILNAALKVSAKVGDDRLYHDLIDARAKVENLEELCNITPEKTYIRKFLANQLLEKALIEKNEEEATKWISKGAEITEKMKQNAPQEMKNFVEKEYSKQPISEEKKLYQRALLKRNEQLANNKLQEASSKKVESIGSEASLRELLGQNSVNDTKGLRIRHNILQTIAESYAKEDKEKVSPTSSALVAEFLEKQAKLEKQAELKKQYKNEQNLEMRWAVYNKAPIEQPLSADQKSEELIDAIRAENFNGCKKAIEEGATLDYKDKDGKSIIRYAAECCKIDNPLQDIEARHIYELLLNNGCKITADDLNAEEYTAKILAQDALKQAIKSGDELLKNLSIEKGAKLKLKTDKGPKNSLTEEESKDSAPKTTTVDSTDSKAIQNDNEEEKNIEHLKSHIEANEFEKVKTLLQNVKVTEDIYTYAEEHGAGDDIKKIIRNAGLLQNANSGSVDQCTLWLRKGADVNAVNYFDDNQTALHYAVENGNVALCKLLLEHKADVNAADNEGTTPFMQSIKRGWAKIVDMIWGTGKVDIKKTDKNGKSALDYAIESKDDNIKNIFKKHRGLSYQLEKISKTFKGFVTHTDRDAKPASVDSPAKGKSQ